MIKHTIHTSKKYTLVIYKYILSKSPTYLPKNGTTIPITTPRIPILEIQSTKGKTSINGDFVCPNSATKFAIKKLSKANCKIGRKVWRLFLRRRRDLLLCGEKKYNPTYHTIDIKSKITPHSLNGNL